MTRFLAGVLISATTLVAAEVSSPSAASDQPAAVTFNRDVLPVLQKNCQVCHRPGQIAPMSFLTYENVRPWAKAIKAAVVSRKMPPWLADPDIVKFRNAPTLTEADINTLVTWADSGAAEGDPADAPASPVWSDGWRIPPEVVVSMAEPYRIAAKGAGEIKEFIIPSPFSEDTWVNSIEIHPGDPSVVHHVILQLSETATATQTQIAGNALPHCRGQEIGPELVPASALAAALDSRSSAGVYYNKRKPQPFERLTGCGVFATMEAIYAPGSQPMDFGYRESAKLIPGGKPLRLEVHYTPNGKETTDLTKVGFTLTKVAPQRRFVIMAPGSMVDARKPIRAREANLETRGELTFDQDVDLVWFMPHMHLRGKDMSFRLIHPNGQEVTVLKARFNFNWQLGYEVETPLHLPKGTRMVITAHHDNSANNPFLKGAEPDSDVQWGELTSQEMMLPWFGVLVEGDVRPDMIASYRPGDFDGALPTLRPPTPKPAPKAAPDAQKTPEILGESGSSRVDQSDIGFWVSRPVN